MLDMLCKCLLSGNLQIWFNNKISLSVPKWAVKEDYK